MSSTTVNVLRWSALAAGVFYGFSHQRTLYKQAEKHHEQEEYNHKAQLIEQAKAEYKKKTSPPSGLITDPDDSRFDLEAFLKAKSEEK
ncbi:hypothetical protein BJ508DRAFT_416815 [Ascobolus immersus RN42]|uniref:ATP synthase F(0) complex subunit e, mitochondrial n=1 Tax=Ascobolus immersus RN42 TaxID=1160509 RepID=A0A3N4HVJ2_ASCIM|nr:hypothetical protein BJ508DRAFT_416815 [Ascobolus immersus RN42]